MTDLDAYAQQLIDRAPLPTPEQIARLRVIIWGVLPAETTDADVQHIPEWYLRKTA